MANNQQEYKKFKTFQQQPTKQPASKNHQYSLEWHQLLRLAKAVDCFQQVDPRFSPPHRSYPNFDNWLPENDMAMSCLINSMEPSISNMFMHQETAKEIWMS